MVRLSFAAIAACLLMAGAAAAAEAPRGSYLESCRNISVAGDRLNAECLNDAKKWRKTWMDGYRYCAGDIANVDGVLKCHGGRLTEEEASGGTGAAARGALPGGPWRDTCRDAVLDGAILRAVCQDRNRNWRTTFLDLSNCPHEVGNADGQLICLRPPPPPAAPKLMAMRDTLPTGKWVQFCRSAALTNYMMRAECYAGDGRWQASDLDLSTCPTTDVTSNGGRLVCQGDD